MLRRRTKRLTSEYLLEYKGAAAEGADVDPADVASRVGALKRGSLGPAASARALRDAAVVVDAVAAECVETIAQIDAEYGEVFRGAKYLSGIYVSPYRRLNMARYRLQQARRLAPRLRSLAKRHERRAARRWPPPGGLFGRPDIAALKEAHDTGRLLRALGHRDDEVRVHAAVALSDLRATEAVDPLVRLLEGAGPRDRAPSKKLRETAVGALATIADPRTADVLARYAREHLHDHEDTEALTGLVQMGDERAFELVTAHLWHGHLPTYAARLLADLGDPRAIPVLRDYITDLEGSSPEKVSSRSLREHYLKAARTALARLDSAPPADSDDE